MGSNSSSLPESDISDLIKDTGFNSGQIKKLYTRFQSLDKDSDGYLYKQDLSGIPELNINPVRERIIEVLITDYGQNDKLNFKQFATVLSTFRRKTNSKNSNDQSTPNSLSNKLKFIFDVYDRDKDNKINKNELLSILNMVIGADVPEEEMNAMAERTILELGLVPEVGISFEKFCETLKKIDVDEKMSMKFLP